MKRLHERRRSSRPACLAWDVDALRAVLAPHAVIRVSDGLSAPVAFGSRRPAILLPADFGSIPEAEQRAVICHELLHVARHDWLWLWAEEAIRTLFWFHPAMRYALACIRVGREELIDARVVALVGARRAYMEALLRFATRGHAPLEGLTFARGRGLRLRMKALSEGGRMSPGRTVLATIALTSCIAATALVVSGGASAVQVYAPGNGVSLPIVVKEVHPGYTPAAKDARIEGTVVLECVVGSDGVPADVAVARSLDGRYGLDAAAVDAMKQWRFSPGTKAGQPVAVRIDVEMTFTLK